MLYTGKMNGEVEVILDEAMKIKGVEVIRKSNQIKSISLFILEVSIVSVI